jgi:hypothetical protein
MGLCPRRIRKIIKLSFMPTIFGTHYYNRRSGMARFICLLASFAGHSRIHRQFAYWSFMEASSGSMRFWYAALCRSMHDP